MEEDIYNEMDYYADTETEEININEMINSSIYGCKHYMRRCKLFCNICQDYFSCRICHDEVSDHVLNRFNINIIKCTTCNATQDKSNKCKICKATFGIYYCKICSLYDDIDKGQYHCDKCNICRIGKDTAVHCDECNMCIDKSIIDNHKCYNYKENVCPICLDNLFLSTTSVVSMPCDHRIHRNCLNELLQNDYKCPLCRKTIIDTSEQNRLLDEEIRITQMPEHLRNFNITIVCNDCNEQSITTYHVLGHKCQLCNSYNTTRIN